MLPYQHSAERLAWLAVQSLACACPLCSLPSRSPACCRSQFFILFKSAAHLNFKRTVFGKLVGGELSACMSLVIRPIQEQPSSTGLTPLAVAMGGGGLLPSHSRCAPLSLQFPAAGLNMCSVCQEAVLLSCEIPLLSDPVWLVDFTAAWQADVPAMANQSVLPLSITCTLFSEGNTCPCGMLTTHGACSAHLH